jgi:hypothetical protein
MEHNVKAKVGDVLVQSLSPFAQRLDGKGFYCVQEPNQGKSVRYVVKLTIDDSILGHIAWRMAWHSYAFFASGPGIYHHRCLADLAEILDYLSKRQRRMVAPGRREG